MKTQLKTVVILLAIFISSCSNDDGNTNQNILLGQWEITSGFLASDNDKYIYFNTNNTADILRQTSENFRGEYTPNYSISVNEITIDGTGGQGDPGTFTYSIEGDILTLSNEFRSISLERIENDPELSSWIQELTILSVGDAPWDGEVDMAFTYDKTAIVYGKSGGSGHIGIIDPETFAEIGQIETTRSARAVEIEKFDVPDRYVFQSDGGSDQFYGYYENSNSLELTSIQLGSWIRGLASIDRDKIWVSSSNERSLYLYNYTTETIEITKELNIQPWGLDYQNEFLYVSDGIYIHKCQISPNFEVLETYKVPNLVVDGIAFDGTNFWVNGYDFTTDSYKIVRTSLTL